MSPSSSWRRARSTTRTRMASTSPGATASCPRSRCARAKSGGAAWPPRPEPHAISRAHRAGRRRRGARNADLREPVRALALEHAAHAVALGSRGAALHGGGLLSLPIVIRHRPAGAVAVRRLVVLSIAAGAPYTLIMYAGLVVAPAAQGAVVITGVTPVVTAALAWLWFGERPWPARTAGLGLIVLGLALVGWPGITRGGHAWLGDALFVVAGVLFALFTVGARHWRIDPLPATAAVWVLALPYVPIYGALAGSRVLDAPRGEVVFQAIFQGLGVAIVALALYAWAIRVLGDSRAALFMPLVPVCGVLLGVAVLGEVPEAVQVADVEQQGPKAGGARVKVKAAGVCHSDWHIMNGDWPLPLPMVLGHEAAGIVEEVAPGVTNVKPGDHVIFSFRPHCGRCLYCSIGRTILCDGHNYTPRWVMFDCTDTLN